MSFVLVPIHTSALSTDLYSINTNYYVYAVFLNALLTLGMETAFFRFFSKEASPDKVISTSFLILCSTAIIFLGFAWPLADSLAQYFGFPDPFFIKLLALTIFFDTLVVIPFAYLRAKGKSIQFASLKIVSVLITLLLNIWLLLWLPQSNMPWTFLPSFINRIPEVSDIFIANLFASILTFLMFLSYVKNMSWRFDKTLSKKMLKYGIPIMMAGIAYAINENLDKLLIARFLGDDVNGMYAGCYKLGVFMSLYVMTFRLGAEPFFFNIYGKEGSEKLYSRILTWFVILACLCLMTITGFVDFFAGILLKRESYLKALEIVPFILLANLFLGIYNNLSVWYKVKDKTAVGMFISISGAILTIILLVLLLPKVGYMGAAYTTLIVYFFMATTSYLLGKRYFPIPYETGKVLSYILIATSIAFVSFYMFRGNLLVNFGLIIGFIGLVYYFEKEGLQQLFQKVEENKAP